MTMMIVEPEQRGVPTSMPSPDDTTRCWRDIRRALGAYCETCVSGRHSRGRPADGQADEANDSSCETLAVELDHAGSLMLLAAVEGAVRIDYQRRVRGCSRDRLSRAMRSLHRKKGHRARFESDLLRLWGEEALVQRETIQDLIYAMRYRHWLAHGRCWSEDLHRDYAFDDIDEIAVAFMEGMRTYADP
ncbi:hypothetical protein [Pandoraea norimbergensis]